VAVDLVEAGVPQALAGIDAELPELLTNDEV